MDERMDEWMDRQIDRPMLTHTHTRGHVQTFCSYKPSSSSSSSMNDQESGTNVSCAYVWLCVHVLQNQRNGRSCVNKMNVRMSLCEKKGKKWGKLGTVSKLTKYINDSTI